MLIKTSGNKQWPFPAIRDRLARDALAFLARVNSYAFEAPLAIIVGMALLFAVQAMPPDLFEAITRCRDTAAIRFGVSGIGALLAGLSVWRLLRLAGAGATSQNKQQPSVTAFRTAFSWNVRTELRYLSTAPIEGPVATFFACSVGFFLLTLPADHLALAGIDGNIILVRLCLALLPGGLSGQGIWFLLRLLNPKDAGLRLPVVLRPADAARPLLPAPAGLPRDTSTPGADKETLPAGADIDPYLPVPRVPARTLAFSPPLVRDVPAVDVRGLRSPTDLDEASAPAVFVRPARWEARAALSRRTASRVLPSFLLGLNAGQLLIWAIYTVFVCVTVALPLLKIAGVPIRVLLGLSLLALLALSFPHELSRLLGRFRAVLRVTFGIATLGVTVSLFNGMPWGEIAQQCSEIYVQLLLNLLLGGFIVLLCGPRAAVAALVLAFAMTALCAVAQYSSASIAWSWRLALAQLQGEPMSDFLVKRRPMGLSLSPINFATQMCLVFAAFGVLRHRAQLSLNKRVGVDAQIVTACLTCVLLCVLSGNRSPLVGLFAFLIAYGTVRSGRYTLLLAPAALVTLYLVIPPILEGLRGSGSRIASLDDDSVAGRLTLLYYGILLFAHNPLGYGLGFDPTQLWQGYWQRLVTWPNPYVVQVNPLHNYILNMLNFYGIGIVLFVPALVEKMKGMRSIRIYFIPYAIHILFHNVGPFWNDSFFWLVYAVVATPPRVVARAPASLAPFLPITAVNWPPRQVTR